MEKLTLREYLALLVALMWLGGHSYYFYQIVKRKISPTLSTWIIFSAATALAISSYLVASHNNIVSGVLPAVDAFVTFVIMIAIAVCTYSGLHFKPFEKYYLIAAGFIALFWGITGNAFIANLLVQILIIVGYLPTLQTLLSAKKNPESLPVWSFDLIAACISLYPAIIGGDFLSSIYSLRAVIMILIVVILMLRIIMITKPLSKFCALTTRHLSCLVMPSR